MGRMKDLALVIEEEAKEVFGDGPPGKGPGLNIDAEIITNRVASRTGIDPLTAEWMVKGEINRMIDEVEQSG